MASLSEVSEQLYISRNTLKSHIKTIYRKLGVEDVPAFVELESGGPSPGACRVVGHG
jgi:DNA-binding CsgD family transcriptional regulator